MTKEEELGPVKDEDLIQIPKGPISEELADELADEAERGYADLANWRCVYVGRPSLSGNGTSPRMSFRMASDLHTALERRAAAEGKSISEAAREAIARYVES
ncbi:MAG: ribbon-helix-helix protein, CopG family [Thermoleophilia bacterium]|nr:ribbon-helix-helix protein, CopG family [Thermoleophilia bacterium]